MITMNAAYSFFLRALLITVVGLVQSDLVNLSELSRQLHRTPVLSPLIPRTVLVGDKDVYDVQISPDGRFIAFLHSFNLQLNVWLWDRAERNSKPRPITDESKRSIVKFQWLYDNRTIVYSQDTAGEENYRLFAIDVLEPTKTRRLLTADKGVRSILFYISSLYPHQIAIASNERDSAYFDLYTLDLLTNQKRVVLLNDKRYKSFHIDDHFNVLAASIERDDGGMDYYRLTDPTTGRRSPVASLIRSVSANERLHTRLVTVDYTGRTFYWIDSSQHDLGVFVAEDPSIGSRRELYRSHESEIDFDHTFFHPITNEPLIIYEDYARLTPIVLSDSAVLRADFERLLGLLPRDYVPVVTSASADLSVWVIRAVSSRRPAEYIVYSPHNRTQPLVYLFNEKSGLLSYDLATTQTVSVPVMDNFTQICYVTRPLNTESMGPRPTVLLVHGGPWTRVSWGFDTHTQTLANRGYVVVQCNFRGSTGYGRRYFNAGNGQWAGRMQDDLTRAVRWAIDSGISDPAKIAIAGSSYGGYAALMGMTQSPEMFACGIDVFGPSNLNTLFRGIPSYWRAELASLKRRIGADPDTIEGQLYLRKWSPLTYAHRIRRPMLVVHGANDARVRKSESDAIVRAARSNGVNVTYVVFPDEGHSVQQAFNGLALSAVIEQFLAKCLGGRMEQVGPALTKSSAIITY